MFVFASNISLFIYLAEKAQKQIKKNPIAGLILQEVP